MMKTMFKDDYREACLLFCVSISKPMSTVQNLWSNAIMWSATVKQNTLQTDMYL